MHGLLLVSRRVVSRRGILDGRDISRAFPASSQGDCDRVRPSDAECGELSVSGQ
jgi:hypothetical protein